MCGRRTSKPTVGSGGSASDLKSIRRNEVGSGSGAFNLKMACYGSGVGKRPEAGDCLCNTAGGGPIDVVNPNISLRGAGSGQDETGSGKVERVGCRLISCSVFFGPNRIATRTALLASTDERTCCGVPQKLVGAVSTAIC